MGFSDDGAIVLGWLTRVAVVLGVLGVLVFDGISLAVTRLGVIDDAKAGAVAGVHAFQETRSPDKAYAAALAAVQTLNPDDVITPGSFSVTRDGRVTLSVQREAVTIAARHVPSVKDRLTMRADGTAAP